MSITIQEKERIQIWINPRLKDVLAAIQEEIAVHVKKEFGLSELTVNGTIASDALAARYLGDKKMEFKIKKTGLNKGILEFTG